jgi:hypothetical protein
MAASERRPAVWPWLVMPLIVLVVFWLLYRVQHPPTTAAPLPATAPVAPQSAPQQ